MKRLLLLSVFALFLLGCLLTPALPTGPIQTEVAMQLTSLVTDTPTEMNLPGVATLVPPVFGAPTQMGNLLAGPEVTSTPGTFVPLPTLPPQPTLVPTADPNAAPAPTSEPASKSIVYKVTGSAASAEIAIIKPDGNLEVGTFTLPFERTNTFTNGSYLSLTARILSDTGNATCEVSSEGQIYSTNTADGTNQMATCVFVLPE
jgi:hypothetical protein